jgi:hypothetical protein
MDKTVHMSKLEMQNEEMARIKKERVMAYEGRIEDREIDVYNHDSMVLLAQQKKTQEIWQQEENKDDKED